MNTGARRCFAALLLLLPPAVSAEPVVPDSATIHANVVRATGPVPTAYRRTLETTYADGTTEVDRLVRRGEDYRESNDTGPFHSEEGSERGQDWIQNDNGQTVLQQPDPGKATPEKLTTTVHVIEKPVHGYVVATLNAHGDGVKDYVDGTAWQIVRREHVTPNGTVVTTFDDVREDHGRVFAHHWHVADPIDRLDSDTRETAYDPSPVTDAEIAMPNPRRALVEFPTGVDHLTLPTQFDDSDVNVRVMVNGRGLDFALDTGASEITIDEQVARELKLPVYQPHQAVTAGRYTTARTIIPEMHVGDLVMHNVAAQIVPQGWDNGHGVKQVGLLGFDFLAELGLTVDYEHKTVIAVPGDRYVAPTTPGTIPLDVRIGEGSPLTTVSINGAIAERFLLDTGGAGTFLIFDYFARRHPEALVDDGYMGSRSQPIYFYGIGGGFDTKPYAIRSLRLANVNFEDFIGYRVISRGSYAERADGLIGTTFLHLFTLGINYGNSRIYLTPNTAGRHLLKPAKSP